MTSSASASETILLAWNPRKWPWPEFAAGLRSLRESGSLEERWGCGNRKHVAVGSRFFLIRLGVEPKGIIGSGWTISLPYAEYDGLAGGARRRKPAYKYVDIAFERLFDTPPVPLPELLKKPFGGFHWITQTSGITINAEIATKLEELWRRRAL